jgi:hypothetical protein
MPITPREQRDGEIKRVKILRNYYRRFFINGESDECFLNWVEGCLEEINLLKETKK